LTALKLLCRYVPLGTNCGFESRIYIATKMKVSTWIALPVYALSTSALVIPNTGSPHDAIAHPETIEAADHTIIALRTEYEKLEILKHQLFALHHEVLRQEHEIFALINQDFKSCSGVKCYLQTALRKAPDFYELFKTHFRHRPINATEGTWDCPWTDKKVDAPEDRLSVDTAVVEDVPELPHSSEDGPFHFDNDRFPPPPPDSGLPPPGWHHEHSGPPPPPHDGHWRPDWRPGHHGPPSPRPPYNNDGYKPWKENPNAPARHPHPHKGPPPFHMPHPAPRHRHFKLILATAGFVVAAVIIALLLKALRVYLANPRVQADRAARREERRARREYKRAACQHRFRQCISRFRRRRSDSDASEYEEKEAMLQQSDDVDAAQHIMGADINSLRRAHEIVGRLMRAEEGRMHNCPPLQQPQQQEESTASSSRSVRSLQTTTTLPPYAAPPPRYSQELSRDMEVVDGFRFTPSPSNATGTSSASSFVLDDADLYTESSVVDCRSRLSMDTETVTPSQTREPSRSRKSIEASMDRFRGQFD